MFAPPLFFILVLEALSREFRTGTLWELLYSDDLVVITDLLRECIDKLKNWETELEHKDLRVDMRKEKYLHLRLNQST